MSIAPERYGITYVRLIPRIFVARKAGDAAECRRSCRSGFQVSLRVRGLVVSRATRRARHASEIKDDQHWEFGLRVIPRKV